METLTLNATKRETTGNSPARALRREGMIPAILYGSKKEPVKLKVNTKEFEDALKNVRATLVLLDLVIEGSDHRMAMIKELQREPMSQAFLHADFWEIDEDRVITVPVPVRPVGISPGVEQGGLLAVVRQTLDVSCKPKFVPDQIEVDITELEIGDAVHLLDIELGEGVEFPDESVNFTVVTVVSPTRKSAAELAAEEEAEEGLEEVEGAEGEEAEGGEEAAE